MTMSSQKYPIPAKLNITIAIFQVVILSGLLILTSYTDNIWQVIGIAFLYGIAMNSGYAMLHEAEHNLLHTNKKVNTTAGVVLALFFPAPFHLIRQGHIGHHLRNRSDDEAFDFYFEGENPIWKFLQLYGTLTGFFWIVIVLSNLLAIICPWIFKAKNSKIASLDRPSEAFFETLNEKFIPYIIMEAIAVLLLHGLIITIFNIPIWKYLIVLFGFGLMWSAMQYVHHFGTDRDVQKGALNLKTFYLLDLIWLNHNWHLYHHMDPTIPWIYLPTQHKDKKDDRGNLIKYYFRMWRGPRKTNNRVQNRYAGKIIR